MKERTGEEVIIGNGNEHEKRRGYWCPSALISSSSKVVGRDQVRNNAKVSLLLMLHKAGQGIGRVQVSAHERV